MKKKRSDFAGVDLINILEELIKRSSWVDRGNIKTQNEVALAELIEQFFADSGLRLEKQKVDGNRYNILVANNERPEILFTAHMDTVRPSSDWSNSPFEPLIKKVGGQTLVYGCGAVDMKGGMAAIISAILEKGVVTRKPFAALFYCGEEVGDFVGMKAFIKQTKMRPKLVVNVEPTNCEIIHSCRGVLTFDIKVGGTTGHGSNPLGSVNAIDALIEASAVVKKFLTSLGKSPALGESTMNLAWVSGGNGFEAFPIPNKIPDYATCIIEIRRASKKITNVKIQELIKGRVEFLGATLDDFHVSVDVNPLLGKLNLSSLPASIRPKRIADMSFGGYYDTQMLNEAWGVPCLIFGPGPTKMMHKTDEYVIFEQVMEIKEVIKDFLN